MPRDPGAFTRETAGVFQKNSSRHRGRGANDFPRTARNPAIAGQRTRGFVQKRLNKTGRTGSLPPVSRNLANGEQETVAPLGMIERQVVDFFVDGVKVLGLPGSIGEIYGMLFLASEPLALDDLVAGLGISKGSASQGLRTLKELGAIREVALPAERRTHFEAAVELKRLVGGFIREQIRPHLDSGIGKIGKLREAAARETDRDRREFVGDRLHRLEHWLKTGNRVLPVVQRLLGE